MNLSIITVCYNSELTIEKTLKSIEALKENEFFFEYIVIDGNSSDKTLAILNSFSHVIDILISEPDSGIYEAMNKGVSVSNGQNLGFLNSDDYYIVENFRYFYEVIESNNFDFVHGNYLRNYKTEQVIIKPPTKKSSLQPNLFQPSSFISRRVYNEIGLFDTKFKVSGDTDFLLRMINEKKYIGYYIDREIVVFDTKGVSNRSNNFNEHKLICEKNNIPLLKLYWFTFQNIIKRNIFQVILALNSRGLNIRNH